MRTAASTALTILLALSAAGGRQGETRPASGGEGEMVLLQLPENLEVRILIEYVSKRMGVNILYDESVGRKRVTISAPARIPKDSLMGLLEGVLRMSGLAIVDADQAGWKKIVQAQDLLPLAGVVEADLSALRQAESGRIVTQVFQLRHAATGAMEQTIRPFLSKPGGNSFSVRDRRLMFITDYAGNLRRISALIELLDEPRPAASIRFVPVAHRDAAELARQVTALLEGKRRLSGDEGRGGRVSLTAEPGTNRIVLIAEQGAEREAFDLIGELDVPCDAVTRTYRFSHVSAQRVEKIARDLAGPERLKDRYRSTVDVDSGMLIVTAPEGIHEEIAELKRQLDVPESGAAAGHVRFYKLMNTTASRVLATIQALEGGEGLDALLSSTARPSGPSERFTGPNVPPPSLGEELPKPPAYRPSQAPTSRPAEAGPSPATTARTADALITVDPNTNTLIVVAPPEVQRIYEQLIRILDKRRPQVMIEATLVTLDTSEDFSLGVDLLHSGSHGEGDYLFFSSFGLSAVDPATGSLALEPGIGLNAALVGPTELSAVIRALATSGRSKVLSAPRVLVNDNATATLTSVSEAPFTSINASDTVSTTSFAGYASAGSTLTVTPRISEGDHLQLQYSVTLNSFTGEGGNGVPPPRQTNNLTSEVTVPDGYAVIVGGLKRRDWSDTASKVPLLGDIPVLGGLFSLTDRGETESTLFVFIRPVILRDDRFEDLKYLSRRDLELAELEPDLPASEPLMMY